MAERLYGIRLTSEDAIASWHADVRYFSVQDASGDHVGGFYVDLFARSGKRSGAWIDECIIRKNLGGDPILPGGVADVSDRQGYYLKPALYRTQPGNECNPREIFQGGDLCRKLI